MLPGPRQRWTSSGRSGASTSCGSWWKEGGASTRSPRGRGANPRTLGKRLVALEAEGIIRRRVVSHLPPWLEYELTVKGRTLNKVVEALARGGTGGWRGPASGPRRRAPPDPCVPPTLFSHGSRISRASARSSAGELSYWDCGRRPRQFDSRLQQVRPDPRGMSEFRLGPRHRRHGIAIRSGGTQSCVMKRWVSSLHYS